MRTRLGSLKKKELVELLIEEACEDERLLDRLRLRVATGEDGIDMGSFRDAVDRAVDPGWSRSARDPRQESAQNDWPTSIRWPSGSRM